MSVTTFSIIIYTVLIRLGRQNDELRFLGKKPLTLTILPNYCLEEEKITF